MLVGPGENAGVVDVGDGIAAAFRIESHNHPSAIEPYQGAATGIGGILRDIFTMGARPIALMDPLRFGPLSDARSRWIAEGVVSGITAMATRSACPRWAARRLRRDLPGQPAGQRLLPRCPADGTARAGSGVGRGQPGRAARFHHGRDGIGGVSVLARPASATTRPTRPSAQRAGGRPVRGEAAHRGVPRDARRQPGGRHPGPRRRRPDLRHQRDRQPRRGGHGRLRVRGPRARRAWSRSRCSPARPGADARHRRARAPRRGARHLRPLGDHRRGGRHRDRGAGCGSWTGPTARCWPTCPPRRCTRTPRCSTGPGRAGRPVGPAGRQRRRRAARAHGPRCRPGRHAVRHVVGVLGQYDHQLFLNTVEGPAATPPCCGSSTRRPAPTPAGAWP